MLGIDKKNLTVILLAISLFATGFSSAALTTSYAKSGSSSGSSSGSATEPNIRTFLSMSGSSSDGKDSADQKKIVDYDIQKNCVPSNQLADRTTPATYLTHFNCGHTVIAENGTTSRSFSLVVEEDHKLPITLGTSTNNSAIMFPAWTFNGTIPGPTMRMTEGDHVSITVINKGKLPHTLHMHSIHPGNMDGVPGLSGDSGNIAPGKSFTYNFIARPAGVYPYHCHMDPLIVHINHGLYGVLIIDRPADAALPQAKEMVMLLNGYSLQLAAKNGSLMAPHLPTVADANVMLQGGKAEGGDAGEPSNDIYTANGVAFYYYQHPVNMTTGQMYRIYLVNILDFDLTNTFHLHGALFKWYPSGTNTTSEMTTDIISLTQGDRGYMEFSFVYPGKYMIHSHLSDQSDKGWMGFLDVKSPIVPAIGTDTLDVKTKSPAKTNPISVANSSSSSSGSGGSSSSSSSHHSSSKGGSHSGSSNSNSNSNSKSSHSSGDSSSSSSNSNSNSNNNNNDSSSNKKSSSDNNHKSSNSGSGNDNHRSSNSDSHSNSHSNSHSSNGKGHNSVSTHSNSHSNNSK